MASRIALQSGSEQPAVIRVTRFTDEYAHLRPLFCDMAGLPEGDRRRSTLRNRLIIEHLPLTRHIARRFARGGEPLLDQEQVAALGLINAVDRFDPDRGCEFVAFAVPTMTGEVRRWFRDCAWSMRVPRRLKELNTAISAATSQLSQELGRAPRPSEIAARLDIALSEVIEGLQVHNAYRCRSLDAVLGTEPSHESAYASALGELDPGVQTSKTGRRSARCSTRSTIGSERSWCCGSSGT